MAKFRSFRKIEKPGSVGCSGIFLLLVSNFQFVAPSVTWKAPHPQWNQTDPNDIRTVDKQVLNGSTQVPLRWRYTLLSGSMTSTIFSIRLKDGSFSDIGMISGGKIVIFDKRDFRTRFDISVREQATLIINRVTGTEDEVYQCKLTTDSNQWSHRIRVIVTVPASLTNVSRDQTVREDSNMKLFCEAIGKPTSNITWTRELEDGSNGEVLHQGSTWDFPKIKRTDAGTYKCTAYNGFGAKVSQVFKVNVTYPPIVFEVSATRQDVEVQESVSLECTAEGNPPPNYTWMPCNERVCHESKLVISEVLYDDVYVCTVTNSLGSDSGNVSIFIGGKVINVTLVITSESCTDGKYNQSSLWTKLEKTIDEVFANESRYTSVQLRDARCGSVTTDLVLKFSSTIQGRQVIDILRNAAKNGMLGELNVNVSSIIGTRPTVKTTTTAAATTPSSPSDSKMGIILIAVLVPLVSLLVTAGVAA